MKRLLLAAITLSFAGLMIDGSVFPARAEAATKLSEVTLSDHGKPVTIRSAEAKVTAVVFVSTTCEVTGSYSNRLQQLYADYAGKNVQFVFVDANAPESFADMDAYIKAKNWKFRVYKDESNRLADRLDAHVTPEVFLFDKAGNLQYHGRVDDSRNSAKVNSTDARAALDAILSGHVVPVAETKAFGCTISRVKAQ